MGLSKPHCVNVKGVSNTLVSPDVTCSLSFSTTLRGSHMCSGHHALQGKTHIQKGLWANQEHNVVRIPTFLLLEEGSPIKSYGLRSFTKCTLCSLGVDVCHVPRTSLSPCDLPPTLFGCTCAGSSAVLPFQKALFVCNQAEFSFKMGKWEKDWQFLFLLGSQEYLLQHLGESGTQHLKTLPDGDYLGMCNPTPCFLSPPHPKAHTCSHGYTHTHTLIFLSQLVLFWGWLSWNILAGSDL